MTKTAWIIEPRDALIVRDGRPFGAGSGMYATSLDFPFPSTTTGGVRTRFGLGADGKFTADIETVKNIEVGGALLASLNDDGEIKEFYLPAPADVLIVQDEEQKKIGAGDLLKLAPLDFEDEDAETDLTGKLKLVGTVSRKAKNKPNTDLKFWSWNNLQDWLKEPKDYLNKPLSSFGIKSLTKDARVHAAISNDSLASEDGALFQTRGLEFNYNETKERKLDATKKMALVVLVGDATSDELEKKFKLAPLGGERRLVSWRKSNRAKLPMECPDEIKQKIVEDKHCRLLLLTPAYFENGFTENGFAPNESDEFQVKAIACGRHQVVSGWDVVLNKPKPTRRLVPAGSVLFLELTGDVKSWIKRTWLGCVGDDPQTRKDGFGLCVLGTWDGKYTMDWRESDEKTEG